MTLPPRLRAVPDGRNRQGLPGLPNQRDLPDQRDPLLPNTPATGHRLRPPGSPATSAAADRGTLVPRRIRRSHAFRRLRRLHRRGRLRYPWQAQRRQRSPWSRRRFRARWGSGHRCPIPVAQTRPGLPVRFRGAYVSAYIAYTAYICACFTAYTGYIALTPSRCPSPMRLDHDMGWPDPATWRKGRVVRKEGKNRWWCQCMPDPP